MNPKCVDLIELLELREHIHVVLEKAAEELNPQSPAKMSRDIYPQWFSEWPSISHSNLKR
jgi:hypothetical protein